LIVAVVALVAGSCSVNAIGDKAAYGTKVRYRKAVPLHFSDFDLTYDGERRVTPSQYPRGMVFYDFRATQGSDTVRLSWSAGTGEIAPSPFKVGGQGYWLELRRSDTLGTLAPDELVVMRDAQK